MKTREQIVDSRLTPTMDRVRHGRRQLFREKNIKDRSFIEPDNCDLSLEHENKAMYAELIDNKWYWVNGCGPCNGEERSFRTYIECEKHDICSSCGISRKDIQGAAWGGCNGWKCNECKENQNLKIRQEAFEKLDGEDPDCDYTSEIICPHCGSEISNDDIHESGELECGVCEGELNLEVDYTVSYTTSIKGKRIIK